jgi:hypothetical protein
LCSGAHVVARATLTPEITTNAAIAVRHEKRALTLEINMVVRDLLKK